MNIRRILNNRTVKNAGWIIGGRVLNKALAFVVGILSANYLGPSNFGLVNYAAAYTTFFASVCTLGINSIIIKNFIDHPEEEGVTIGTTLILRAVSSVLSALMIMGIVMIVDRNEKITICVVVLSSIGLVFQVFDTLNQWFQSRLQSKYAAMATIISYLAVSGYKIFLLMTGKDVIWFALATSIDYIVVAVFLLIAYKRNGGRAFAFSFQKTKELLSASGSFYNIGLMVSIYASTDKLMLKQMMDEEYVGYYALAVSLSTTWGFVLQAMIDSIYPSIIQAHGKNQMLYKQRNRQLYAIVIYTALFMSGLICAFADPIIELLYEPEYSPAIGPLRIVVWYTTFSYLGVARNAWIVCENKQKYLKYLYASAAVINVVLNWLLIPAWGACGAAVASLITQVSTTIILPAMIKPLRENTKIMVEALLLKNLFSTNGPEND